MEETRTEHDLPRFTTAIPAAPEQVISVVNTAINEYQRLCGLVVKKRNRLAELEDFKSQAISPRELYIRHNLGHSKELETKYAHEVKEIKETLDRKSVV